MMFLDSPPKLISLKVWNALHVDVFIHLLCSSTALNQLKLFCNLLRQTLNIYLVLIDILLYMLI